METFDVIVIGGGSGLNVSSAASDEKKRVALIEPGPMGGTCLNRGCIPSKILIHSADVARIIQRSSLYGISAKITGIDFKKIIGDRASSRVDKEAKEIEEAISEDKYITLFKTKAFFTGNKTLQVGNKKIFGDKIVVAAGTRPSVPPVEGIHDVPYITSDEALRLKKLPKSMTVLGGGYIAAELADFYSALGTKITVIQRSDVMVKNEDAAIAKAFTKAFAKHNNVLTGHAVKKVEKKGKNIMTTAADAKGKEITVESEQLLVAAGRVPNTDVLQVDKTGAKMNKEGYVETNQYMETNVKHIWALGDIAGKYLFKHSANAEAKVVVQNAIYGKKVAVNYTAMPHAIFSSPQVAGVGERQQDLDARRADYAVGEYRYIDTGMGLALEDTEGFVRVYVDRKTLKILGCHILGTDASTAIHEVILAMRHGITAKQLVETIHIHPALSEVVQRACANLE